ncbi:hypothetical protein K9L16_02350 [Candidatus Pacearchaeota archaeon]|nr:hypothetical protein [Candidatus Pacearchaeota archaeon]
MVNKIKIILILEVSFILVALIYLFFSFAPKQIYPLTGMVISEPGFVFEIQNADKILISPEVKFKNPILFEKNSKINLPPGTYFWKVQGKFRESEISNFTIKEHVSLELKNFNGSYELWNTGNTELNIKENSKEKGEGFVLSSSKFQKINASENTTYIGVKNE